MSRFVPSADTVTWGVSEETCQSPAFQLGVCQSLIEQVLKGQLDVAGLRERYTARYPEWDLTAK